MLTHMVTAWIASYGSLAVFVLVLLEAVGLPLPGETALISAALYAGATHRLGLAPLVLAAAAGASIGGTIGWRIGVWIGNSGLRRYGPKVGLTPHRLALGRLLFRHYGSGIVFVSRFFALFRNVAAVLAGSNAMPARRFIPVYGAASLVWAGGYGIAFDLFGRQIHRFEATHHTAIVVIVGAIVVFTLAVAVLGHRLMRRYEGSMGSRRRIAADTMA